MHDDEDDLWSPAPPTNTPTPTPKPPARGVRRARIAARVILLVAASTVGWFAYRALSDDGIVPDTTQALVEATTPATATDPVDEDVPDVTTAATSPTPASTASATSTATERRGANTTPRTAASTTLEVASEPPIVTSTSPLPGNELLSPTSPLPGDEPLAPGPIATLPDGSPVPVLAIFDTETITLSGAVPSEEAAERLGTLALANSKTPAALQSFLTIDPAVPINVGVRVIELNSARFPEGTSEILPEHAVELDRVVAVMNALPHVTALVIGHADQRGSEEQNFVISEARARAVVGYLVGQGIAAERLSSRAVGETDLLTLANDDAALALNRRTEFVFYGLLVPTAPE